MASRRSCGPVLVVDDDAAARLLACEVLSADGLETSEAATGSAALAAASVCMPAAVVLDVKLPDLSGWEVCSRLRTRWGRELPIVFVSGVATDSHDRVAGLLLGGDDFLVKPYAPDELLVRVRGLLRRAASPQPHADLTPREFEVLRLLAAGLGAAAIAERLVLSPRTVRTYAERILGKLEVHSRAQAVALAYREGLIAMPV